MSWLDKEVIIRDNLVDHLVVHGIHIIEADVFQLFILKTSILLFKRNLLHIDLPIELPCKIFLDMMSIIFKMDWLLVVRFIVRILWSLLRIPVHIMQKHVNLGHGLVIVALCWVQVCEKHTKLEKLLNL